MLQQRKHDWGYFAERGDDGQAAGRMRSRQGDRGSSSINAMIYVRGHRGDYERWAEAGLTSWSYAHVLPLFPAAGMLGGRRQPIAAATGR
jgi:choline dehydrogenase/4-pyridoxate dehydrogenase